MSQAFLLSDPVPSVSVRNGRPATTSQEVARYFNKRHDNVVRDVRSLITNTPERFRALNFEETSRTVLGPNNSERQEIYFTIYRDGFMLLVMGYTGKKALAVKLAYIEAFNRMEAELFSRSASALPPAEEKTTVEDRKPLKALVSVWSRMTGIPHTDLWPQVRAQFGIARIDQLRKSQLPAALAWVQAKIDALPQAAQKELPPAKDRYAELEDKFEEARQTFLQLQSGLQEDLCRLVEVRRLPGSMLAELPSAFIPMINGFLNGGSNIHDSWSRNPVRLIREIHRAFGVNA